MSSLLNYARASLYDTARSTRASQWYSIVLRELPEHSYILAVGIGTGSSLLANANVITARNLCITAIDADESYVNACNQKVTQASLQQHVFPQIATLVDYNPRNNRLFSHIIFVDSFATLHPFAQSLRAAVDLLVDQEDGRLFFAQALWQKKSTFAEWLRPKLSSLTSVNLADFVYEGDFDDALHDADLVVVRYDKIDSTRGDDDAEQCRLVVARARKYVQGTIASYT